MIAICAIENQTFLSISSALLEDAGYEVGQANDRSKLLSLLNESAVDLVICDRVLGEESITDLPVKYPKSQWFIHLTDIYGLAAASSLCSEFQFADFIPMPAATSNIYAAIWMARNRRSGNFTFDSNAVHAKFQSQRSSVLGSSGFTSDSIQDDKMHGVRGIKQNGAQCLQTIQERFFKVGQEGTFANCHLSAIFYRIMAENKTGRLHLRRPGLHWVIFFKDGAPFDIDMRMSAYSLDFPAWAQKEENQFSTKDMSTDLTIHDNELTRRDRIKRIPENVSKFRAWIIAMMNEIFAWPQAEFQWMDGNIPPTELYHPQFSLEECLDILETGVFFWQSKSSIMDITQSVLPYFLKLKDNGSLPEGSVSAQEIESIVEQLKLGDTLTEMLAVNQNSHLVHAVIYLLIMMGHLELIS